MITAKHIATSIVELLEEGKSPEDVLRGFESFVVKQNLASLLPRIVDHLNMMKEEEKKKKSVHVEVANKSAGPSLQSIIEKLGNPFSKDLHIDVRENEALIAGFKVTTHNTLHDWSFENQLVKMKAHIKGE